MHKPPKLLVLDWYYRPLLANLVSLWASKKSKSSFKEFISSQSVGHHFSMKTNLSRLGWLVDFVPVNSIQAIEEVVNEVAPFVGAFRIAKIRMLLRVSRFFSPVAIHPWLWPTLASFLQSIFLPDLIYVQDARILNVAKLKKFRAQGISLVLQQDASLPRKFILRKYDGMVSSLRWLSSRAEGLGLFALHLPLGFDLSADLPRVDREREIGVSFVGSVTKAHPTTLPLLRAVAQKTDQLQIYGPSSSELLSDDTLRPLYRGEAWGAEMLQIMARSKIALNRHGFTFGNEAGNYRLYEATASGATLVTDDKAHIQELFNVGQEILTYRGPDEAADIVLQLLNDDQRRLRIASAGQKRTVSDHTLEKRMLVLSPFLLKILDCRRQRSISSAA